MERRDLTASILAGWRFLERAGLAESFAVADPLPVNPAFRDLIIDPNSGHQEIYRFGLRNSHYNFLLFDHSFFQFSWFGANDIRYAYYPNPHVSKPAALHRFRRYRELVQNATIDEEEFDRLVSEMGVDGGVPVFRFEHAPHQYVALNHPCAHFHIGVHGDNRWAVARVLTALAFTKLIVKHYYPEEWGLGVVPPEDGGHNAFEVDLREERRMCIDIEEEFFNDEERRSFHFG